MTVQEIARRHKVSEVAVRKKCPKGSFSFGATEYVAVNIAKPGAKKSDWLISLKGSTAASGSSPDPKGGMAVDQLKHILLQAKVKKEISAGALLRQKAWEGRRKIELDFAERFLRRLLEAFAELRKLPEALDLTQAQREKFRGFLAGLAARSEEIAGDVDAIVEDSQEKD